MNFEYEKLLESAVLNELRIQKGIVLVQIILEVIMYFPICFAGEMYVSIWEYLGDYVLVPSMINVILVIIESVLCTKFKKLDSKIYCVSIGFILMFAVIYTVHVTFYPFILLFPVPMLMTLAYGKKRIPQVLCFFAIIAKIVSDVILGTVLATRDMNRYHTFSDPMSILNMVMFAVVMLVIARFISTIMDVEEKKRSLTKDLAAAVDTAESASRAKSSFLANMSHEIRTPINGILGMDAMILKETGDEVIRGYAKNIQSAGNSLLSIINDILDISKIESGKMEIIPAEYKLSKLLRDSYNVTYLRAEDKGLYFNVNIDPEIPEKLFGDEIRILQIMNNLLSNAVKYTNTGEVSLSVSHTWISEDEIILHILVEDTGIGIKDEDMDRLFSSFERLEEERNRGIEGTGLGLNLTRYLVHMMGGVIHVESVYGTGSRFSVDIRQKVTDKKPLGNIYEQLLSGADAETENIKSFTAKNAKILIVDDVDMNLQVARGLLKDTEINIDTAMSGFIALNKTKEVKYDIIFLDHLMPKMDGIETADRIRKQEFGKNRETPIVMLTANALMGAREEYIKMGFYDYLSKPIEEALIKDMIQKILPEEYISLREAAEEMSTEGPKNTEGISGRVIAGITEDRARKLGMDFDTGLHYCMGDENFYANMIEMFISAKRSEELSGYLEKSDFENYRISVHALKSTSASIGLKSLSEEAKRLEDACKEENYGYVRENHDRVMEMYDRISI